MSSESTFVLQAAFLFLPWIVAAVGGLVSFRLRTSRTLARAVQFATAVTLCGLSLIFWQFNHSIADCFVPAFAGLAFSLHLAISSHLAVSLVTQVLSNMSALAAPRLWGFLSMGISPLILAGGLWQIDVMATPPEMSTEGVKDYPTADLVEMTEVWAYTDRGHRIPLQKIREDMSDSVAISGDQGLPKEGSPLPYRAIRIVEPDTTSNCIGWVFAGAHGWILCRDVQQILDDNGYLAVKVAREGDAVVYYDSNGNIVHAGMVVAMLDDGRPLVESKWGYQGVFLHLPEGTPYGDAWTFYRSARQGHLLHMPHAEDSTTRAAEASP
jgi:hypothetical protein